MIAFEREIEEKAYWNWVELMDLRVMMKMYEMATDDYSYTDTIRALINQKQDLENKSKICLQGDTHYVSMVDTETQQQIDTINKELHHKGAILSVKLKQFYTSPEEE